MSTLLSVIRRIISSNYVAAICVLMMLAAFIIGVSTAHLREVDRWRIDDWYIAVRHWHSWDWITVPLYLGSLILFILWLQSKRGTREFPMAIGFFVFVIVVICVASMTIEMLN